MRDFDVQIMRGDRIGILGPNGSGKTTLLRLLLGEIAPRSGRVERGTRIELAYFDQHRGALDDAKSVADNVADGSDHVHTGAGSRHVLSYLGDFLFGADRARVPAGALSGGERARLALARLFAVPSNLLVMDEPTNDLDIETLELLEERLLEYEGTLLLVSHDRAFLDNVVTSVLAMEGDGRVGEYVGGWSDWERQRPTSVEVAAIAPAPSPAAVTRAATSAKTRDSKRLSYNEQRELAQLPARIEALEGELEALNHTLSDPAIYRDPGADIAALTARVNALERELGAAYERWSELES